MAEGVKQGLKLAAIGMALTVGAGLGSYLLWPSGIFSTPLPALTLGILFQAALSIFLGFLALGGAYAIKEGIVEISISRWPPKA